jgi:outer membrane protein with beta-barrel domain
MKRCAYVAILSLVGSLSVGASTARAQTPPPAAPDHGLAVEVTAGPTLGHKSAGFVSGEMGWRLTDKIDLFVEGGHMTNVGTSLLDANAGTIADFLGASVGSSAIKVNHFDAGIKFNITPPSPKIHPYVVVGAGVARATTEVSFTVNGTVIDPGGSVSLGGDLAGSNTKAILMFGGGITYPFGKNYFADFGYRFGGILSKVSDIENDITIKTQRIILGAGVRF